MLGQTKSKKLLVLALLLGILFTLPTTTKSAEANTPIEPIVNVTLSDTFNQLSSYTQPKATARPPVVYAHAFALIDQATGQIISGENLHTRQPIASTTKMTTALVARQEFKLDDVITIPKKATLIEGSKAELVAGEKLTINDLLKALLIPSGNDAAYAIAYADSGVEGNYQPFVDKMNTFATDHHLADTHFSDPAGLDDTGYSSAFDLATIGRLVLADPVLSKIVATQQETIVSTDGTASQPLKNSNRLLDPTDPSYLPTASGIKTGFTPAAGHCLIAADTIHGRTLVAAILNTDNFTITASAEEAHRLFLWADQNIETTSY